MRNYEPVVKILGKEIYMGLFAKAEYKKVELPFCYIKEEKDDMAGGISIEAFGEIEGVEQYFYFSFQLLDLALYDNGGYEEMLKILENSKDKKVIINIKYKNEKIKGFSVDTKSLAQSLNDERFEHIDIVYSSWGKESRRK
jgi:hypothetical protein